MYSVVSRLWSGNFVPLKVIDRGEGSEWQKKVPLRGTVSE